MKELGASTWEEALITLRSVSPIHHVEHIQAPVLLVHGEKDRTAPLEQAQHLYRSLQSAGKRGELFIVPAAGHVFNFRDEEQGKLAWEKTIEFLDRQLKENPYDEGSEIIK
jgi:dipeptidyl aminopeptidase/acylaminoacyl peptidase